MGKPAALGEEAREGLEDADAFHGEGGSKGDRTKGAEAPNKVAGEGHRKSHETGQSCRSTMYRQQWPSRMRTTATADDD